MSDIFPVYTYTPIYDAHSDEHVACIHTRKMGQALSIQEIVL